MNLPSGTQLGPFVVRARLGEGGMADVWRALDTRTGQDVALKVLDAVRRAENPGLLDRMLREAAILESLQHVPAVVRFVERLEDRATGTQILALELIEGESLAGLIGFDLQVRTVLEWMGHACHALHDVHEAGWVHRDLKPDNLLLVDDPDLPLRLIDFNSAGSTAAGAGKLTRVQGVFPHTPAYLAPECFDGVPPDASADVYAIAMTFTELLLGHHPLLPDDQADHTTNTAWQKAHEGVPFPHLPSVRPDVPEAFHQVLARACAKERSDRIPDAVALWAALKEVWDTLDTSPAPTPTPPPELTDSEDATPVRPADPAPVPRADPPRSLAPPSSRTGLIAAGFIGAVALAAGSAIFVQWQADTLERQRMADVKTALDAYEVFEQDLERATTEGRRAAAERARLKAEQDARRAAQERAARAQERARGIGRGVDAVAPNVTDAVSLEKIRNASRMGSHFLYDWEGRMGTLAVSEMGGVMFLEGRQGGPHGTLSFDAVVTELDARGMTVNGTFTVTENGSAPCGRQGTMRFNLSGHPWYFRQGVECPNGYHYVDIFVDDAWLARNPAHAP